MCVCVSVCVSVCVCVCVVSVCMCVCVEVMHLCHKMIATVAKELHLVTTQKVINCDCSHSFVWKSDDTLEVKVRVELTF